LSRIQKQNLDRNVYKYIKLHTNVHIEYKLVHNNNGSKDVKYIRVV